MRFSLCYVSAMENISAITVILLSLVLSASAQIASDFSESLVQDDSFGAKLNVSNQNLIIRKSANTGSFEVEVDEVPNYSKDDLIEFSITEGRSKLTEFCSSIPKNLTKFAPSVDKFKVKLLLSERSHVGFSLSSLRSLVHSNYFRDDQNVTVFFTGWKGDSATATNVAYQLSKAYSCRKTHNFLILDIAEEVTNLRKWATYDYAMVGSDLAANLSNFFNWIGPEKVHLIGHGIGAHVAGSLGAHFHRQTGNLLARITGLDPANSCLQNHTFFFGLQRGDAAFVDVIHTNIFALGSPCSHGDIDIFVRSFTYHQLGCEDLICEHNRAVEYYIESVLPNGGNVLRACKSYSLMDVRRNGCVGSKIPFGLGVSKKFKGNYYFIDYDLPSFGVDASRCESFT